MPEPRPLVAIERQSGSVSEICLSGEASNAFSIAASRFTSSSSFSCGSLAVGGVELAHVARHTLFDLLLATLDLALREVVVATVHGLELAAVDGNAGLRQQAHLPAQLDKSCANLPDRGTIVLAEVGDGLVIRREPSGQPHHLEIAAGLALETTARLHAVQIAVDVEFEQHTRTIRGPTDPCRVDPLKAEIAQIQCLNEHIDRANRIV